MTKSRSRRDLSWCLSSNNSMVPGTAYVSYSAPRNSLALLMVERCSWIMAPVLVAWTWQTWWENAPTILRVYILTLAPRSGSLSPSRPPFTTLESIYPKIQALLGANIDILVKYAFHRQLSSSRDCWKREASLTLLWRDWEIWIRGDSRPLHLRNDETSPP